ncbi:MAG: FtsB family cell division protein [Terriglobia bacterium]
MKPPNLERKGLPRWAALAGALVVIALIVRSFFGANGFLALRQKRRESQALSQQIEQLKQENSSLEKDVQGLKSDPATIERYAREELHMARPGELIYMLPPQPSKSGSALRAGRSSPKP